MPGPSFPSLMDQFAIIMSQVPIQQRPPTFDEEVIYKYENLGLAEIQEFIFSLLQKMCRRGDLTVNQIRKENLAQTQIQEIFASFPPFSLPR